MQTIVLRTEIPKSRNCFTCNTKQMKELWDQEVKKVSCMYFLDLDQLCFGRAFDKCRIHSFKLI